MTTFYEVTPQGLPYLDLRKVPALYRLYFAMRFFGVVKRHLATPSPMTPRYTIVYRDCAQHAIGLSPWPITYPCPSEQTDRVTPYVIRLEDRRFWLHHGIDWRGLARAVVANMKRLRVWQGASTITQQLARNTFLYPSRSVVRKLLEWALALVIERSVTKDAILKAYCDLVYLGPDVRGFAAAARLYHRTSLPKTSDSELRAVVGCLRTPNRSSPLTSAKNYRERAAQIDTFLSAPPPGSASFSREPIRASHFRAPRLGRIVDAELAQRFSSAHVPKTIRAVGLTVSSCLQSALDQVLTRAFQDDSEVVFAAALAIDSASGAVLAESSFREGKRSAFSPSFAGRVQAGSTFKTFVLLEALRQGLGPDTTYDSAPYEWQGESAHPWRVRNFNNQYHGRISLRQAIALSDNTVFARLTNDLGLENVLRTLRDFDLISAEDRNRSVTLGATAHGVSLAVLARAYAALGTGYLPTLHIIRSTDFYDRPSLCWPVPNGRAVAVPRSVLQSLREVLPTLSARPFGLAAVKTGTAGATGLAASYDDRMSYAVWVGFRSVRPEWWAKGVHPRSLLEQILSSVDGAKFLI